jgi:hypothetical protein
MELPDEKQAATIAAYQYAEQDLAGAGYRVKFLGNSHTDRPCPTCYQPIALGDPIINSGKIEERWRWVCLSCAPDEPLELSHVKDVLGAALRENAPQEEEEEEEDHARSNA